MTMETTIKVSKEFRNKLKRLKQLGQSYQEFIQERANL